MTTNKFDAPVKVNNATAKVASATKDGIDAASAGADHALNVASNELDAARGTLSPTLDQGIDRTRRWVDDKASSVQDGMRVGRDMMNDLTEQVADYTRDEPIKALLIAAAVGAGLTALGHLVARRNH